MSNQLNLPAGVRVTGPIKKDFETVLTRPALEFVAELHRRFEHTRQSLLKQRQVRQVALNAGVPLDFNPLTRTVRDGDWKVAPVPADLQKRWVEITGPCNRKMVINALNSGADCFMADLEDSTSPTWENVVSGQINLRDAVNGTISFPNKDGSIRKLRPAAELATLMLRPRGWHLDEGHVTVDGSVVSGALFDFALFFFHNCKTRLGKGTGPYFYLPKLESHQEARLWNDVFRASQDLVDVPQGTIKCTVLIETIFGAIEMDEILYELRDHIVGLNAGRWDYIFSVIKRLWKRMATLPDRGNVGMDAPFMRAYTELLVRTCHRRGAHCIGGMSAFIPNRKEPEVTKKALAAITVGKRREVGDGCDGTWVAHPDLVEVVRGVFQERLQGAPHQKHRLREDVSVTVAQLINTSGLAGSITSTGVRTNVHASLAYIECWLRGVGAVGLNNKMEDAATAEISRAQLWQWIRTGAIVSDTGKAMDAATYQRIANEELRKAGGVGKGRFGEAKKILDDLVLAEEFPEFLTLPAYAIQDKPSSRM